MNLPKITIKIDDRTYHMDISDGAGIRKIPKQDRQHLLMLLSAIKKQEMQIEGEAHSVGEKINHNPAQGLQQKVSKNQSASAFLEEYGSRTGSSRTTARLDQKKFTSRDADELMERLIAEEKKNSKRFTKPQLYMVFSTGAVMILLLLLSFV